MTVAWPHHACVPLSKSGGSTVQCARPVRMHSLRSSPLGADMVCKSRNSFGDVLFTQRLMALVPPTICCVRAQSAREYL